MQSRALLSTFIPVLLLLSTAGARAQDFYKDKIIRFIVGQAAGGGYDSYTRTIAHHMIKHIPGNPAVTVENMTGAGSLVAANYLYNTAKPDGLTSRELEQRFRVESGSGRPQYSLRRAEVWLDRRAEQGSAGLFDHGVCRTRRHSTRS